MEKITKEELETPMSEDDFMLIHGLKQKLPKEVSLIQSRLFAYLAKLQGYSSRKLAKETGMCSHTFMAQAMKEGEGYFKNLHYVMREINKEMHKQYKTLDVLDYICDYLDKNPKFEYYLIEKDIMKLEPGLNKEECLKIVEKHYYSTKELAKTPENPEKV